MHRAASTRARKTGVPVEATYTAAVPLFSPDTRPEAVHVLVSGYRRMTPLEKLARVDDLTRTANALAEAGIRMRHPRASDEEVRLRRAALVLGRDTMLRVFGWDPDVEGW